MSSSPTLNSRLRVLVAKTFRAEKLYASVRNVEGGKFSTAAGLTEIANDVRAKEWQRCYYQLRQELNDLLSAGAPSLLAETIARLATEFKARAIESAEAINDGSQTLIEATKLHEFAKASKLSIELVKHKARTQAQTAIAEELFAVLHASGRSKEPSKDEAFVPGMERAERRAAEMQEAIEQASNVIPLRRHAGSRR